MNWQDDFDKAANRVAQETKTWKYRTDYTDKYLHDREKSMNISWYAERIYRALVGARFDPIVWAYMGHHDDGYEPANKPFYDEARRQFEQAFPDYDKMSLTTSNFTYGDYDDDEFYNSVCQK